MSKTNKFKTKSNNVHGHGKERAKQSAAPGGTNRTAQQLREAGYTVRRNRVHAATPPKLE